MSSLRLILALQLGCVAPLVAQQSSGPGVRPAAAQTGLLVVAHGADAEWNGKVRETVAQVRWDRGPVAVAFLMGAERDSSGWQPAVERLTAAGAREIVVVPLMVSSYGAHYRQIRYYAGELAELPADLRAHEGPGSGGYGGGHGGGHASPPRPTVPMRVTAALDAAPQFAEALAARWQELGEADRRRPLLLVAHGPNDVEDARRWLQNIGEVSAGLGRASGREVRVGLLKDDAPAEVRARAVAEMRDTVLALAARAKDSVVALPVMISTGSLTRVKIPRDLAGLPIHYVPQSLAPLPALARWIEASAGGLVSGPAASK